jgi:hypothetical protein
MFDGGNPAKLNDIAIKGLQASALAPGKIDRFSQGTRAPLAILKMAVEHHKLRSSTHRQGTKRALKSTLHRQLMPARSTCRANPSFLFSHYVMVNRSSHVLGSQVAVAQKPQSMVKIACRRHGRSVSFLFFAGSKRKPYRYGDDFFKRFSKQYSTPHLS